MDTQKCVEEHLVRLIFRIFKQIFNTEKKKNQKSDFFPPSEFNASDFQQSIFTSSQIQNPNFKSMN